MNCSQKNADMKEYILDNSTWIKFKDQFRRSEQTSSCLLFLSRTSLNLHHGPSFFFNLLHPPPAFNIELLLQRSLRLIGHPQPLCSYTCSEALILPITLYPAPEVGEGLMLLEDKPSLCALMPSRLPPMTFSTSFFLSVSFQSPNLCHSLMYHSV